MFGDERLLQQFTKAVVERSLQGEMTHHHHALPALRQRRR